MPRVALPDSCSYTRYLDVSTLHTFQTNRTLASSSNASRHHNFNYDAINNFFMQRTFHDPTGYPQILDIIDLRPL
jgi:hypothetical protein